MHTLRRLIRHRPRLTVSLAAGAVGGILLPQHWQLLIRILAAWNMAIWAYLILMGWLMMRASHARVCRIAGQEDRSATAVLSVLSLAAVASIAAIVMELTTVKDLPFSQRAAHYLFTGMTVFGSWCLVAVLFTFHYAHLFYVAPQDARPIRFANDEPMPNYWDFMYLSFTIAVAAQTSDVNILSRSARKTVLAQSILSFVFNTAILGLSINMAAGLIGA